MCSDWEKAKKEYIDNYCKDNENMRQIVEKAFGRDPFYQELLAEWLEEQGNNTEAVNWRKRAALGRKLMGHDEE